MKFIVPLIGLGITFVMIIAYIIMSGKNKKQVSKAQGQDKNNTSQFFINVMDIHDNILYGMDGLKRVFIEVEGICIDLLNKNDINRLIRELSSEISKINVEFDLFAISRPFNIDMLKNQYEDDILNAKTDIQRTLLRNSLKQILAFGENGEVVERKFYIIVQGIDNEPEIEKKADLLIESFKSSNITCYRLKDNEIKRLINLFNNMTTYNYDDMQDTNNSIPIIKEDMEKKKTIDEKLEEKLKKEKEEQIRVLEEMKKKEEEDKKQVEEIINTKNAENTKSSENDGNAKEENINNENNEIEKGEENGEEKNEN